MIFLFPIIQSGHSTYCSQTRPAANIRAKAFMDDKGQVR